MRVTHRPVVVEMAELVGKPLHVVGPQSRGVTDHIEVGGGDRPLAHRLAHQEEVIPERGRARRHFYFFLAHTIHSNMDTCTTNKYTLLVSTNIPRLVPTTFHRKVYSIKCLTIQAW